ncbi:hypothetical protein [Sphingomonas sp. LHG3406-1]|uniref:hypothetical protein n=1 Tax=Sphingomonas sp. LHG3406-1 TaxID=2804617 RepID=UPI00261FA4EC|nr:hypothetical protein [Sphingomonas sp. LHG3406-1]
MLVYGDAREEVATAALLAALKRDERRFLTHDELRSRFIALAGLAQGVADADFAKSGADRERPAEAALLQALVTLGAALMRSWDRDCEGSICPPLPPLLPLPASVTVKQAEGYAHYALYPEAYALAARKLVLAGEPRIIGLRSIGTGLAAVAAAALGAKTPVTLRPGGDPFARSLSIAPELEQSLLDGDPHFVIVDEGPGLSGSSFGAVADWLEARGVPAARIAFLPGHHGDLGMQASARHRERWRTAQRPVLRPDRLTRWTAQLLGPIERWTDISAGGWRPLRNASESEWPAVVPGWERMKFLVRAAGKEWMLRFAGLGPNGHGKLALARTLHEAGFGPEVAGMTHGWLALRWHADARPARPTLDELTVYLRIRSLLPVEHGAGASLAELVAMVRRNVPELARWSPEVDALQPLVRRVRTDGRMEAHEWLRLPGGQLLKADALDHHAGHDLVGAQDLAWDLAGVMVEFDLPAADVDRLERALGVDPALTAFYRIAYCAFRIGRHGLGVEMSPADEAPRHAAATARYRLALVDAVEQASDVDQSLGIRVDAFA